MARAARVREETTFYPEPFPLGVCDPDALLAAISLGDHRVEILDLRSGIGRNCLSGADRPLMIDGDRLIAWHCDLASETPVILYRTSILPGGKLERLPLPAPEWLRASGRTPTDIDLLCHRRRLQYRLNWRFDLRYVGGAPPPPHLETSLDESAEQLDISIDSFTLVGRGPDDWVAREFARSRRGEALARTSSGMTYFQGGALRNAPWRLPAGDVFLRAEGTGPDGRTKMSVARADAPDAFSEIGLEVAAPGQRPPELSLDGRHIALIEDSTSGTGPLWRIHDAQTARCIGGIPHAEGFGSFRVIGAQLFCLDANQIPTQDPGRLAVDRAILSFSLPDGLLQWRRNAGTVEIPDPNHLAQITI